MSFILDALKKSENERQRQNSPGIASIPDRVAPKSPFKWIWLVATLITVNVAVLGALILWKDSAVPDVEVEVPLPVAEKRADDVTFSERVSEVKRNQSSVIPETEPKPSTTPVKKDAVENDSSNVATQPRTINDGLPSLNELRAKGELQLPEIRVDIHVYSETPEDRFVFLNMSKHKEGSTLSEGPLVKEIRPDGVVLEHQNKAFLLPRQ